MGILKKINKQLTHKRKYFLVKMYSFYRKDFQGLLKQKRFYKQRIILYNILRQKKKFYYRILYFVYHGVKFFNKKYNYKSNLLLYKKCLKFFYGYFYDSYMGKIGRLIKRKKGVRIDNFFGLLERRLDILIYRAFYTMTIRTSYLLILKKVVFVNNILKYKPSIFVYLGDIILLLHKPMNYFFFSYTNLNKLLIYQKFYLISYLNSLAVINYSQVVIVQGFQLFSPQKQKYLPYGFYFYYQFFQQRIVKFVLYYLVLQQVAKQTLSKKKIKKMFSIQKKDQLIIIFKFIEIFKYSLIKQQKSQLIYTNIKFLYGQKNIKKRFKFLFFFLSPSYKKKYLFKKRASFLLNTKKKKILSFLAFQ